MTEEAVFLNEGGVFVSNQKVIIGNQSFITRNIGGVAVGVESRRRLLPIIGMIFFGLLTLGSFPALLIEDGSHGVAIFMLIMFAGITLACAMRSFAPNLHYITVTAAGGVIKVMPTKDTKFLNRIIVAIHQATE